MALKIAATPRDRLDRILDYVRRARRYWWVALGFLVLGAGASVAFAVTRPPVFQSSCVLFYQERIQSGVLQGRDAVTMQRNIGERYREVLLARSSLAQIIQDPALNPYPQTSKEEGLEAAVEDLRLAVGFEARGSNTFRINYSDVDPDRAKKVTERLTELLLQKEAALRKEQSSATVKFAEEQKTAALDELRKRRIALNGFLDKNPEFALDAREGASEGAAVRAREEGKTRQTGGNPKLQALERQERRIQASLEAADNPSAAPPPMPRRERTPEQIQADQVVRDAEREVQSAQRELDAALQKFTERHPDVVKAREQLTQAQGRLRRAEGAVPRDEEEIRPPRTATDRAALQKELTRIRVQIETERAREKGVKTAPAPEVDTESSRVVRLETQYGELRQGVAEQQERVEALDDQLFRAQMTANQQIAEGGSSLTVVDPAFAPKKPQGKGKKVVVIAGLALFTALGLALALGLAIIDDRLYRRVDVEQLSVAPVLAVIPRAKARKRRSSRHDVAGTAGAAGGMADDRIER